MVRNPLPRTLALVAITLCMLATSYAVAAAQPLSSDTALPGARRMVLLDRPASVASLAVSGQYGFTGSVLRDGDRHHRLGGRLALALHPAQALSFGVYMSGRRDTHSGGSGQDDSIVGDPGMFALLRLAHAGVFRLGLGVELWAPGGDSPGIVFEALSPTATLYSQLNLSSVTLALRVGYLHDRSARTVPDGRTYTPGDQVSLGVTAADAVLVGLGITGRAGPVDLYADVSLDALVRRDGLSFAASRAAATLGAMLTVAARYHLGMEASVHLGSYPRIQAAAPYRVEPRVTVGLVLAADLGALRTSGDADDEASEDEADAEAEAEATAEVAPSRTLRGRVAEESGAPLPARVTVLSQGQQVAETATNEEGVYELGNLPPGPLTLVIEAEGRAPSRTEIGADVRGELDSIALSTALPDGEIRGSVHGLRSAPVAASIVLESTGQAFTADDSGHFAITVAPGSHVLHIEAPGYLPQDRHVDVEERGVVVIEVHLRPL